MCLRFDLMCLRFDLIFLRIDLIDLICLRFDGICCRFDLLFSLFRPDLFPIRFDLSSARLDLSRFDLICLDLTWDKNHFRKCRNRSKSFQIPLLIAALAGFASPGAISPLCARCPSQTTSGSGPTCLHKSSSCLLSATARRKPCTAAVWFTSQCSTQRVSAHRTVAPGPPQC